MKSKMKLNVWTHLPNAVHIDRVLASAKAHPDHWAAARHAAWETARDAAWDAIFALVAYDDCAYMLDSDPGELAILAAFGDHRAILLLSACKVFHSLKTIA